ncbi:transposase [Shumkonia mesophila]|uniref:transposase n=1 Tax=Shumkonia mesophila TaxID=2838854 RepID=UPI002934F70C|nr:transposase [Shumkonia mesophila]
MKKSKFTDQQIAFALQQAEAGMPVEEVYRKMGISQATYFRWKKFNGGLMPSEVQKPRHLVEENTRLIVPMIERFMATDRGFAKARRTRLVAPHE